ncbi:MAG: CoA pyrophosphatase [Clostridiales bacterium]|nr:CoA pyrophosphatase [Clostridiales bacterium]MCF8022868.1 CoA pyrophosphatase [Clostridiales bacterium]
MNDFLEKFSGREPYLMDKEEYSISAVLVPVIKTNGKTQILFEVRSPNLDRQPGEICFPGGMLEKDESPSHAAVRETSEELGIAEENIELAGPLDLLVTPIGKVIHPYVGKIPYDNISPDPVEVKEVFTIPLDFFLNNEPVVTKGDIAVRYDSCFPLEKVPAVYGPGWKKQWNFSVYYYEYENYFIWGITSKILVNFLKIINQSNSP